MHAGWGSALVLCVTFSAARAEADAPGGSISNDAGAASSAAPTSSTVATSNAAATPDAMPTPIDHLGDDVVDAFTGTNLFYYGGAVVATGVMAFGGADQSLRKWTQEDWRSVAYGDIASYAGYVLPAVVAPGLYVLALALRDRTLAGAGAAATQALAVTLVTTGFLKVATGRPFPTHGGDPNDPARLTHPEYARELDPFAFAGKYAWPSGHTSSTVSVAAALTAYYPEAIWVPLVSYPIALAIGVGMVDGDHHWASDVLAGALIGQAIGWSIGRDFRHFVRERETRDARSITGIRSWQLRPLAGATYGLALTGTL